MQIRNLTAGLAIMGAGVITPISAPAFAQGAESYASEIAAFESMRSSSPSGALASETSVMALLSNIPAPFEVSVGSFFSEGGGDVAENVEITFSLEDEFTIGFRIEELRAYGLSDSQISALAANETAELGSRIDMRGVTLFGLEPMMETFTDAYVDGIEGMVEGVEGDGDSLTIDADFSFDGYEASFGQIIMDGLTWHSSPDEVNAGITALYSADELTEEQGVWAIIAPVARFYRSVDIDQMAMFDTTVAADVTTTQDGVDQNIVIDFSVPMVGSSGMSRGDTAMTIYRDASYVMNTAILSEEIGEPINMDMSGSIDLYVMQGFELSTLFGYLETQTIPDMSVSDLMSLGTWDVFGEQVMMGDQLFYSVAHTTVDISDFNWFVPQRISMAAEDMTYNVETYIGYIQNVMSGAIAEGPDAEEVMQMMTAVRSTLSDYGVETLTMDINAEAAWDAETGASVFDYVHQMDGFGRFSLGLAGEMPSMTQFAGAIEANQAPEGREPKDDVESADAVAMLMQQEMALTSFDIEIDDDGGLEKVFGLAIAFAQLAPEDDSTAAMMRNSSPSELRGLASGLTRMSGMQVGSAFPPALEYVNGVADFILNGGTIGLSVEPEEPLNAAAMETIEPLFAEPDALVDYLGVEFEYSAPE
ncbi:hypothetical protein [Ponticaulis sp.]|uniref:hypothetical protein n=1 Tax=Ponticaulis sp. TaxID=2020902 RepID=UPI0025F39E5C|nr:hypothetical protein [Ponticaulis sp.]|tara:strand:- start:18421 stop:20361 length:1941 start_codon:yes stop_codon:yes gene_type:complete